MEMAAGLGIYVRKAGINLIQPKPETAFSFAYFSKICSIRTVSALSQTANLRYTMTYGNHTSVSIRTGRLTNRP
jgi:hypothetical protein